jgi:outer membrane autotransporter protein
MKPHPAKNAPVRAALAALALALPALLPAQTFNATGTGLWGDASNWTGGVLPAPAANVFIGTGTFTGTAVINTGTVSVAQASGVYLNIGYNTGGTGGLILEGDATLDSMRSMMVGRLGGNGAVIVRGSACLYLSAAAANDGALFVGHTAPSAAGAAGQGYLELSESGSVNVNYLTVGRGGAGTGGAAQGTVVVKDNALLVTRSGISVGGHGGDTSNIPSGAGTSGTLLLTGNGRIVTGAAGINYAPIVYIGSLPTTYGHVIISGSGHWESATRVTLGAYQNSHGLLELAESGSMKINGSGGAPAAALTIGGNASATTGLMATGTVIAGGSSALLVNGNILIGSGGNGASAGPGTGVLILNAGALVTSHTITLAYTHAASAGAIFLNGGTLATRAVTIGAGTGALHFNGGVLQAAAAAATFIPDSAALTITNTGAGAAFDTNGHALTLALDLGGSSGGGSGGLTKLGDGALTLAPAQTYTGATRVTTGTLALAAADAIATSTAVFLGPDAVLASAAAQTLNNLAGTGTLANTAAATLANSRDTAFAGALAGPAAVTKTGAGALEFTGAAQGLLTVGAGALTVTTGTLSLSGVPAGTGTLALAAGGTLALAPGAGKITGGALTFDSGAVLDIRGAPAGTVTLAATDTAITTLAGLTLLNNGASNEISRDIYNVFNLSLADSGKTLQLASTLVWTNTAGASHGTFNIAAGGTFAPGLALADRSPGPGFTAHDGWDGKSLTKTGAGTLDLTAAAAYTGTTLIQTGTLRLTAPDAIASSAAVNIAANATLTAATGTQTLQNLAGAGALTATGPAGSSLFILHSTFDTTFAGAIAGEGRVEKTGAATLTLTAAQTHTGATTLSAGTLALAAQNALATSAAVNIAPAAVLAATAAQTLHNLAGAGTLAATAPAAALTLDSTRDTTYAGQITAPAAGVVTKTGAQTLTLAAAQPALAGTLAVGAGTLSLTAADALAGAAAVQLAAPGAALASAGAQTLRNLAGAAATGIALGAAALTLDNTAPTAYAGDLAAGAVTKTGPAAFTFSGTGAAASLGISAGSFDVFGTGSLALAGALDLAASATLGITAGSAKITAASAAFGAGSVINIRGSDGSTGSVTLIQSTAPIATALPVLLSDGNPIAMSLDIPGIYSLLLNSDSTAVLVDTILVWNKPGEAHGTFNIGDLLPVATALADRAPAGFTPFAGWDGKSLTKTGAGTLVLAAQNTYTGTTLVNAGTLALAAADAIAASSAVEVAAGAVIAATGTQTLKNLSGGGTLQGAAAPESSLFILHSTFDTAFAGALVGEGGVEKTGPATLTLTGAGAGAGAGALTGTLAVTAGKLLVQNAAAPGAGTLAIAPAATVEFNLAPAAPAAPATPAATGELAARVAGSGTFTKTGAGALTLAAPGFAAGAVGIGGGTLAFGDATRAVTGTAASLSVAPDATLALGAGARLTVTGTATLADNSALSFVIGAGAGPALTAAALETGANVALNIAGITGTATGARFTLIDTAAGIIGDFNPVTIGAGAGNPGYLTYTAAKTAGGKRYTIEASLAWTAAGAAASGTFTLGAGESFTVGIALPDTALSLPQAGAGTLVLSAQNDYTGATLVADGTLVLAAPDAIAASTAVEVAAGAVIAATGTQTLKNLSGSGTLQGAAAPGSPLFILHSTFDTAFDGVLTGEGGVAKTGAAALALTARSTYEGDTAVLAGRLIVPDLAHLGAGASDTAATVTDTGTVFPPVTLAIAAGATLEFAPAGGIITTSAGTLGDITAGTGGTAVTRTRRLAGAGTLQVTATAGTLVMNRDNPVFAGAIALAGGFTKIVSTTTTTVTETTAITGTLLRTITTATTTEYLRAGEVLSSATATVTGTAYIAGTVTGGTVRPGATTTTGLGAALNATSAGAFGAGAVTIGEGSAILYSGVTGTSFAAHNGIATRTGAGALALPVFLLDTSTLTLAAAGAGVERVVLNPASILTLAHPRALGDGVAAVDVSPAAKLLIAPAAPAGAAQATPAAPAAAVRAAAALGGSRPPGALLPGAAAGAAPAAGAAAPVRLATVRLAGTAADAATFGFAPAADVRAITAFATAEIGALAGTDAGNKLAFNVDLSRADTGPNPAGAAGNFLRVTGAVTGSYAVTINTGSARPAAHGVSVEILHTDAARLAPAALALDGATRIETGLTAYELRQGDGTGLLPDRKSWYLADTGVSRVADQIFNTAALLTADWAYALDSAHQRLGDLRATAAANATARAPATADRWLRFRAYRLEADSQLTGLAFEQNAFGLTAGLDKLITLPNATTLALGGLLDTAIQRRRFDGAGDGETKSFGAGVYGSWLHHAGWFADALLRVDNYENTLGNFDSYGQVNETSYNTRALGLSLELGRCFTTADGWWVEVSAQAAALRVNGSRYDTHPGQARLSVRTDAAGSLLYRAQVRLGRQWGRGKFHPYLRAGAAGAASHGGAVHAADLSGGAIPGLDRKLNYEGARTEFGAGFAAHLTQKTQFYLDYEYAAAARYTRPWSANIGYRRAW